MQCGEALAVIGGTTSWISTVKWSALRIDWALTFGSCSAIIHISAIDQAIIIVVYAIVVAQLWHARINFAFGRSLLAGDVGTVGDLASIQCTCNGGAFQRGAFTHARTVEVIAVNEGVTIIIKHVTCAKFLCESCLAGLAGH